MLEGDNIGLWVWRLTNAPVIPSLSCIRPHHEEQANNCSQRKWNCNSENKRREIAQRMHVGAYAHAEADVTSIDVRSMCEDVVWMNADLQITDLCGQSLTHSSHVTHGTHASC